MLSALVKAVQPGTKVFAIAIRLGLKQLKYFIDSAFREKILPVPGSVLYCDLWVAVEHSGIYIGDGKISNIVVDGLAESVVKCSDPRDFTSKSVLGRKIYVSCDHYGAVGHPSVACGAKKHVGERAFYGLIVNNCHDFSRKCVNCVDLDSSLWEGMWSTFPVETWEPTLGRLKGTAWKKLGATKWRLWDWDNNANHEPVPEPDWQAHGDYFRNLPLDPMTMKQIRAELVATQAYETEISDENIPGYIRLHLEMFRQTLSDISQKYEEVKQFLDSCPGASFSYADLQACTDDFSELAKALQSNAQIKSLARKMGRHYISEEKKKQTRIPQASRSEIHGTHRSDDVMRMLPSELLNLEDETLEVLFYARLLEKSLLSYELKGMSFTSGEDVETSRKRTGPVVACLDTSGSMQGAPLLKAKALLLAIAGILKKEDRSLHVLLFGGNGEIREFSMVRQNDSASLLKFLRQGFGGGTDFETPLKRAFEIIALQGDYKKADVLMISDGDCSPSPEFTTMVKAQKKSLDCMVYSVLCAGTRSGDAFSDEVVVL